MRVFSLTGLDTSYSCISYLLLGDQNSSNDINTLIDTGIDDSILKDLEPLPTGIGKQRVQQILLTHNHYDHIGGVCVRAAPIGRRIVARRAIYSGW
jgi:glyoxylase-like metal-dependent hydrolase (beta-lactamase superfamily II)